MVDNELFKEFEAVILEWGEPIELDNKILPIFNVEIFPDWLKHYIEAVAEETQTPLDAAAMNSIAILSTTIDSKFEIQANGSKWIESLNTYTVIALESSERKTAVYKAFLNPITEYQDKEKERLASIIIEEEVERNTISKKIEYLKQLYSKEEDQEKSTVIMNDIKQLAKEVKEETNPLTKEPKLYSNDITPESIAEVMSVNNERLSILSDEGAEVYQMMAGRYSNKVNLEIYLKAFSGGNVRVDRASGKSISLNNPKLTIGIYIQPSVFQELPISFSERGLTQRFLYSIPKSLVGSRKPNPDKIPKEIENLFKTNINRLLNLKVESLISLKFDDEAQIYLFKMLKEIEIMLGNKDNNSAYRNWLGKLCGQIIRVAGLLHIAENIKMNDIPRKINLETLLKADSMRDYFIQHAECAFGIIRENENLDDVKYILNKITTFDRFKGQKKIVYQDLWQLVKRRFSKSRELKRVLHFLEEMNYIKLEKDGRKLIILVNPRIIK
ncbi:hydrogenase maturation factor [Lysinibacillus composti]|uniref:DUF3987 domain-containing protein n=1 Tax=Lysinibacillus composti TaxID=720633 RepID=A0A3N9UE63_9BACI|nr:YfjI family protein [Lysinibacillus composti]MBM7608630.1 hydrogenase maturation factor [Lysinibacillus composti]RQW74550.1 DUF3987 domain-containing protein [Lysinibacillus composti]